MNKAWYFLQVIQKDTKLLFKNQLFFSKSSIDVPSLGRAKEIVWPIYAITFVIFTNWSNLHFKYDFVNIFNFEKA